MIRDSHHPLFKNDYEQWIYLFTEDTQKATKWNLKWRVIKQK